MNFPFSYSFKWKEAFKKKKLVKFSAAFEHCKQHRFELLADGFGFKDQIILYLLSYMFAKKNLIVNTQKNIYECSILFVMFVLFTKSYLNIF